MGGINFYGWTHSLNTKNMDRDQYNSLKKQLKGQIGTDGHEFNKFELKKLVNAGDTKAVEQYLNQFDKSMAGIMGVKISTRTPNNPVSEEFTREFGINPNSSLVSQLPPKEVRNAESLAKVIASVNNNYDKVASNIASPKGPFAELFA